MFGLMDEIKQAREALDAHTAAWIAKVDEYDRSEAWRAAGYGSVEAAIADACRMDRGVLSVDVQLARKLEQLPLVDGGPTDLDNLQLLCWHHHRQRHLDDTHARAAGRNRREDRGDFARSN